MINQFYSIENNVETEIIEKKSKFIANLIKVESKEEAEEKISEIKKKYHDARHNCIAYRIIEDEQIIERASDDGEPSGTAGGPMLNILKTNNLANVLIVVTRYFGGILLGTGGLVRAYSDSLLKAIEKSKKIEETIGIGLEVEIEYNNFEKFKYYCKNEQINIVETEYSEKIKCRIEMEEKVKPKFIKDYEEKNIKIEKISNLYKKYISKVY